MLQTYGSKFIVHANVTSCLFYFLLCYKLMGLNLLYTLMLHLVCFTCRSVANILVPMPSITLVLFDDKNGDREVEQVRDE